MFEQIKKWLGIKAESKDYDFDEKKELKIYLYINNSKKQQKFVKKKYIDSEINKYSDWKEYIEKKFCNQMSEANGDNFKRFLYEQVRLQNNISEGIQGIITPVEIGICTVIVTVVNERLSGSLEALLIGLLILVVILVVVSINFGDTKLKRDMYNDIIEIIESKNE